jgi:hypothetical protein
MAAPSRKMYGVQFHPEVTHTPWGKEILRNFLLDACGCRPYDQNGDNEVTWSEYFRGELQAVVAKQARDAGLGDRGGASARPSRPSPPAAAAPQPAQPQPARVAPAGDTYAIPDRVEVNYDGTWYPGNIYAARNGRYLVDRDGGYMTDDRWVTAAELRRPAPARVATGAPTLIGEWRYRALIKEDGSTIEVGGGSVLELKRDGTFNRIMTTGGTSPGTVIGTYSLRGNRLTLNGENRDPLLYTVTLSADGLTLTLRGDSGVGYRLSR